jgi:hypothetical protein
VRRSRCGPGARRRWRRLVVRPRRVEEGGEEHRESRDNIAYGNPDASEEQILAAARATYVDRSSAARRTATTR